MAGGGPSGAWGVTGGFGGDLLVAVGATQPRMQLPPPPRSPIACGCTHTPHPAMETAPKHKQLGLVPCKAAYFGFDRRKGKGWGEARRRPPAQEFGERRGRAPPAGGPHLAGHPLVPQGAPRITPQPRASPKTALPPSLPPLSPRVLGYPAGWLWAHGLPRPPPPLAWS